MDTPSENVPVDMLTKVDVTTSNGALLHLIRSASLRIDKEDEELLKRQRTKTARLRSRKATDQLLEEEEEAAQLYAQLSAYLWST